jgi:hypothetical protein
MCVAVGQLGTLWTFGDMLHCWALRILGLTCTLLQAVVEPLCGTAAVICSLHCILRVAIPVLD